MTTLQNDLAKIMIGCRKCDSSKNFYLIAKYYSDIGLYTADCLNISTLNVTENSICGDGKIMRLEGLIESERVLTCKSCEDLIPNCLMCTSNKDCDLCKMGYRRAEIKDANGVMNVVCV